MESKKYRCWIIEDEPRARQLMTSYVQKRSDLFLAGTSSTAEEFISQKIAAVDLLFLDIHMPGMNGIDFLQKLDFTGKVILTTAYAHYAVKAFDLSVVDYLLKPFSYNRFDEAIDKFEAIQKVNVVKFLNVKISDGIERVAVDNVLFIKAMHKYIQIYTSHKRLIELKHLSDFEKENSSSFMRVHRSYLVNPEKVEGFVSGKLKIGKHLIPVSNSYKTQVSRVFFEPRNT